MTRLLLVPATLRDANAFIARHHRHHGPSRGCVCVVAVADEGGATRGVAIIGRPVARGLQDGFTAEVTRVATDGTRNACSMLYGAAWRAVRALGYRKLVTYTLATEQGTSLVAAGWRVVAEVPGRSWSRTSRPRIDSHPTVAKRRWEAAS